MIGDDDKVAELENELHLLRDRHAKTLEENRTLVARLQTAHSNHTALVRQRQRAEAKRWDAESRRTLATYLLRKLGYRSCQRCTGTGLISRDDHGDGIVSGQECSDCNATGWIRLPWWKRLRG